MNNFKRIAVLIIAFELILACVFNIIVYKSHDISGRFYRVEAGRILTALKAGNEVNVSDYETIVDVVPFDSSYKTNNDYMVVDANGKLYSIEYRVVNRNYATLYMNIGFGFMLIVTLGILVYVNNKVLKPFNTMSNMTLELAKGNLTTPIKEDKNKFFGKFLWGMDMLRDNLESNKQKELELQKEKKTLILSLSHDIKTPLSAIRLYTKALNENLYDTKEKQEEAFRGIDKNITDIEKYVSEIVTASKEDFLNLEVTMGEFYMNEVIEKIAVYYKDKFASLHTEFKINSYDNCLLKGDKTRLEEVLQNMLENAIKYGDGKSVEISFDDEEDCRLISISNSGNSLKKEEIPHLFESFYRGSNSEGVKGSGLGLYICKSLLRMMDGDIFANIDSDKFIIVAVVRKV